MRSNTYPQVPRREEPTSEPVDLARTALLLDIDGTILDIALTPERVVVPASLRETLAELHRRTGGALALVSGRLIEDVDRLFAPLRLPAIGGHGAELRLTSTDAILANAVLAPSAALKRRLLALASLDSHLIYEDKGSSVAVHYRLAPQQEPFIKAQIAAMMAQEPAGQLDVIWGKLVVEIKPAAINKGIAVGALMKVPPFAGRTALFIGDDTTDLSVFEMLPSVGGRGFAVGRGMSGALGTFDSPRKVRSWLAALCGWPGDEAE